MKAKALTIKANIWVSILNGLNLDPMILKFCMGLYNGLYEPRFTKQWESHRSKHKRQKGPKKKTFFLLFKSTREKQLKERENAIPEIKLPSISPKTQQRKKKASDNSLKLLINFYKTPLLLFFLFNPSNSLSYPFLS